MARVSGIGFGDLSLVFCRTSGSLGSLDKVGPKLGPSASGTDEEATSLPGFGGASKREPLRWNQIK